MILDYDDSDYEITNDDIHEYLKSRTKNELIELILDIVDYEDLRDELTEYFEDEARESYNDSKEYEKDPLGYYGMSESDFI